MLDNSIFAVLQDELDRVPIERRGNVTIKYDLKKTVKKTIKATYQQAAQQLFQLSYYLDWSRSLGNKSSIKPEENKPDADNIIVSFHNISPFRTKEVEMINNTFSEWINNQLIRELNEMLMFHFLGVYETSVVINLAGEEITARKFIDGKVRSEEFERQGMEGRLRRLKKEFGFKLSHKKELCSLYHIRNIFAHFNGNVQKKFCKNDAELKVSWPTNTYMLRKRDNGGLIPYHLVPKPFRGEDYSNVEITWLNKPEICLYRPGDKIQLAHGELSNLIFFYLYVFGELQERLVNLAQEHGIKAEPFEKYSLKPYIHYNQSS